MNIIYSCNQTGLCERLNDEMVYEAEVLQFHKSNELKNAEEYIPL